MSSLVREDFDGANKLIRAILLRANEVNIVNKKDPTSPTLLRLIKQIEGFKFMPESA